MQKEIFHLGFTIGQFPDTKLKVVFFEMKFLLRHLEPMNKMNYWLSGGENGTKVM